jgi:hypothetical protein
MVREIGKRHRGCDAAPILVLPQQQVQKGGLAPAVSAGEPQLPIGIDLKVYILKDVFIAAIIGKS